MKRKALIIDLDGTMSNADHRKHFVENKNWDSFYANLVHDEPNKWCHEITKLFGMKNVFILLVSGRPEKYGPVTLEWLEKHGINFDDLFMRKDGDFRKDSIVKEEIYRAEIEPNFEVLFCIDDRKQVVDMWRSIGLTCLQCAEGNF